MPTKRVLLSAYTIRIRKKQQKAKHEKLDAFDGSSDFLKTASDFLQEHLKRQQHDPEAKHLMNLQRFKKEDRTIAGIIRAGQYGQACDVYDAAKSEYTYKKNTTEADMLPFYFRIEVPTDCDEGFLIVQRVHSGGIKTSLTKQLATHFETLNPDLKLEFNGLMPEEIVRTSIGKGQVQKVRFIHYGFPSDIAERYGVKHREQEGTMELVFKARRNSFIPLKDEVINFIKKEKKDVGGFYELKGMNFEVQEVKVEVKVGKQTRTVNLAEIQSSPIYDVTPDVQFSKKDGNVTYESIHAAAESIAEALKTGVYGETVA